MANIILLKTKRGFTHYERFNNFMLHIKTLIYQVILLLLSHFFVAFH